jgi:hypothetical protein
MSVLLGTVQLKSLFINQIERNSKEGNGPTKFFIHIHDFLTVKVV